MNKERLPELDELYRSLIREKNKVNNLDYFMKVTINPKKNNKIEGLEAEYIWTEMDNSGYVDNSELLKNLRKK